MANNKQRALRRRKARAALFAAQSGRCHYCKIWIAFNQGTVDHMHPTSKGGADDISNMVFCCRRCNAEKAALTYNEYLAKVAKKKEKRGFSMANPKTITDDELAQLCATVDQTQPIKGLGLTFNEALLARLLTRIRDDARTIKQQTEQIAGLEQLRPYWAMGYSSDSTAAQCATHAMSELHQMLRTDNQTEAVSRLRELIDFVQGKQP